MQPEIAETRERTGYIIVTILGILKLYAIFVSFFTIYWNTAVSRVERNYTVTVYYRIIIIPYIGAGQTFFVKDLLKTYFSFWRSTHINRSFFIF